MALKQSFNVISCFMAVNGWREQTAAKTGLSKDLIKIAIFYLCDKELFH